MASAPYKAEERGGYWVCVDTRTGQPASYPTSKANCRVETRFMNHEYAKAVVEASA